MPLFLRKPPPPGAPRSFADLMGPVGQVHRELAKLPGAQRIDPAFRAQQANMLPGEILEEYNRRRLFGTTATGEPIRGTLASQYPTHQEAIRKGLLPEQGSLRLDPESKAKQLEDPDYAGASGNFPRMSFYPDDVRPAHTFHADMQRRMREAALMRPGVRDPQVLEINAMSVTPFGPESWASKVPGKGKEMYAALYDMIRASGHGNMASTLTEVNQARRLGNVASHNIGHGDLRFIGPVAEFPGYMPGSKSYSPQTFDQFVSDPDRETLWLTGMLGKGGRGRPDLHGEALELSPRDLLGYDDDQILGMLLTREAQLSGTYGPASKTKSPILFGNTRLRADDTGALRNATREAVLANKGDIRGAFGPHSVGRQLTTEETILRVMRGESPDEIAADMIQRAPIDAYRDRYKKGGLVAALQG